MKCLVLFLINSKTVISEDRIPSFTCVMRCHTSSLKYKGRNLISSNSVAGAQLSACWLANPNIHQLLNPGQITTPVIIMRLYIIFLWTESSRRALIPIVNPPLKPFRIFGKQWGAHSYLDSPKNNKKKENFRHRSPILMMTY